MTVYVTCLMILQNHLFCIRSILYWAMLHELTQWTVQLPRNDVIGGMGVRHSLWPLANMHTWRHASWVVQYIGRWRHQHVIIFSSLVFTGYAMKLATVAAAVIKASTSRCLVPGSMRAVSSEREPGTSQHCRVVVLSANAPLCVLGRWQCWGHTMSLFSNFHLQTRE